MTQRSHRSTARHSQRGVTLVVGMIMLVLITLVVLASFHLGRNNLVIVGNAQQRNDALTAAQQTIEAAVNSPLLTSSPASIFPTPCSGWPENTLCWFKESPTLTILTSTMDGRSISPTGARRNLTLTLT